MRIPLLALLLTFLPTVHAQLDLGLLGHWTFAGGSTQDQSGQGNDGVIAGSVATTADRAGNPGCALQFPGTTSHVAVPFSADLDVEATDAFTISLWYQGGSEEMGDLEWLFAKRAAGSSWNTTDYALSLYDLNRVLASGSNGELWSPVMPPIPDPTWHHLAYRYNNGIHHIWLDNVLVGSDSTQQVTVGQSAQGITIGEQFEGAMDDIRYYGRALSAEEVELLYQEEAACTIGTGLTEAAAPALSAAPNPATDLLTVQLPTAGGTLELFDATGRSVHRLAVTGRTAVLSLGHLPKGLYLLQYGSGAGAMVQRIAKR